MFDIEKITVEKASILNGKWRIWGTGSLFVWFPLDIKRPWREKIFFVHLKNKRMTIGLTVEHVNRVIEILRNVIPVEIIEHVDNNRK